MSEIITVTGPIQPSELGRTLSHEHLYCDLSVHSGRVDNRLTDTAEMIGEMIPFRAAGGRSILEMTCEGIGRDPSALQTISKSSGVQIISGIAFYDYVTWPPWTRNATAEEIADYFTVQIRRGVNGVRAGVIGEIASHNGTIPDPSAYRLDQHERRLFAAAALAQQRTGVGIVTHASLGRGGHAQLDALQEAGADLSRVAIGHCDAQWHADIDKDLEYYLPMLERGAFCAFDMIGWTEFMPDSARAERIAALAGRNYAGRILLSSDTCRRSQLRVGGGRGLDYVFMSFLPRLRQCGVTETHIRQMTIDAPCQLLCGNPP